MAVEARFCSGYYVLQQDLMSGADNGLCSDSQREMMMMLGRLQKQQSLQLQHVNTHESCRLGLAQMVGSIVDNQQQEIDQYIISQYEGLRLNLQEQRKRDLATILNRMEATSRHMLTRKDQELTKARSRASQLQLILYKAETEQQQWRKLALDREAQVIHLSNSLQQMLHADNENDGDAESCCDVGCLENRAARLCRICRCREACVVLLPCRHLCSCAVCESVLDSCPVCTCLKQGAIEALIL